MIPRQTICPIGSRELEDRQFTGRSAVGSCSFLLASSVIEYCFKKFC